jgi:hypothetical protein
MAKKTGKERRRKITDVKYQPWYNITYVKMTFYRVLKFHP